MRKHHLTRAPWNSGSRQMPGSGASPASPWAWDQSVSHRQRLKCLCVLVIVPGHWGLFATHSDHCHWRKGSQGPKQAFHFFVPTLTGGAVSGHLCQRRPGYTSLGIGKGSGCPLGWWEGDCARQPDPGFYLLQLVPPLVTKRGNARGWPSVLPVSWPSESPEQVACSLGLGWASWPSHVLFPLGSPRGSGTRRQAVSGESLERK